MSFHDVRFPTNVAINWQGGPGFNTVILQNEGGVETRIARWASARGSWRGSYNGNLQTDIQTVLDFFMARSGALFSFRFKWHKDFTTATDGISTYAFGDVQVGTGDGTTKDFQLVKKYTSGAVTRTRNITKPVSGAVKMGINGVEQTSGWTVNATTGIVSFTTAPGSALTVTAGFEFDNHVRFSQEMDRILNIQYVDPKLFSLPQVQLVEVKDEVELADEFFFGGAVYKSISGNLTLSVSEARFYNINSTTANNIIFLPSKTNLPTGEPYFYIRVSGTAVDIQDDAGNILANSVTGKIYRAVLGLSDATTKQWYLVDG